MSNLKIDNIELIDTELIKALQDANQMMKERDK